MDVTGENTDSGNLNPNNVLTKDDKLIGTVDPGVEDPVPSNDGDKPEEGDTQVDENQSDSSETSEKLSVEFTEEQQQILNDLAAKKTKKIKEAEQRAQAAEKELQRLRQQQAPEQKEIVIPDYPDPYDSDYKEKLAARDKLIEEKAKQDASKALAESKNQEAIRLQQQAQYDQVNTKVETYRNNAVKHGITKEDLQSAGSIVANVGLREDVVMRVLDEPEGGLMTMYMAKNPSIVQKLNDADPFELGTLYGKVKENAKRLKKRISNAPDPTDPLKGNGVGPKKRGPKGASFT